MFRRLAAILESLIPLDTNLNVDSYSLAGEMLPDWCGFESVLQGVLQYLIAFLLFQNDKNIAHQ